MLVLTRKKEEGILIGDNVRLIVVEIRASDVRLGIIAPVEIGVVRSELLPFQRGKPSETIAKCRCGAKAGIFTDVANNRFAVLCHRNDLTPRALCSEAVRHQTRQDAIAVWNQRMTAKAR